MSDYYGNQLGDNAVATTEPILTVMQKRLEGVLVSLQEMEQVLHAHADRLYGPRPEPQHDGAQAEKSPASALESIDRTVFYLETMAQRLREAAGRNIGVA